MEEGTIAIIVAIIALVGNIFVSWISNSKIQALIAYRLEQLEKKVEKHNSTIERTYKLEERMSVVENDIEDLKK